MSPNPPKSLDKVRANVLAEIVPLCPETWDFQPGLAPLTKPSKTTVYTEYTEINPLPKRAIGNVEVSFDLTVVPVFEDVDKAEEEVDADVVDLIVALDGHEWIVWVKAVKKSLAGKYLGWTISITAIAGTSKTEPDPEPDPDPEEE